MIDTFTVDDLHELEAFARVCFDEFNYPGEFNWKHFHSFWDSVLKHGMGEVWKSVRDGKIVGSLGMTVFADPFNGGKQAVVSFWHMAKEHRNTSDGVKMMVYAIREAKQRGCYRLLHGHPVGKNESFFKKFGFQAIETGHQLLF